MLGLTIIGLAASRSRLWAASLGVKIDVISNTKKRWLASLHKRRKMSKLLVDPIELLF